jgi:hypothetical protein
MDATMINTVFIGIDPGVSGALAVLAHGSSLISALSVDTPTIETRGTRREYQLAEMRALLRDAIAKAGDPAAVYAVIEDVNPMPREGVVSAGAFMRGVGLWEGLLAGLQIPYSKVRPQVWKKEFAIAPPPAKPAKGRKKDPKVEEAERRKRQTDQKARAIVVAQRLFPSILFSRKKDHGRAEALLLAEYARRHWKNTWGAAIAQGALDQPLAGVDAVKTAWNTTLGNPKALRPE